MMLLALQCVDHLFYKVIDIEQFKFYRWVVDRDGEVISNVVAEGGYGGVVVGTAPFAIEVGEAIDQDFGSRFLTIPMNRSSPAFLLRPYSLLPKRPVKEACWELESITGQVFL